MVIGYLPNPENKFLVGQPLTATIFLPPDPDTVAIPTDALNQVEGQNLVFVENVTGKNEFFIRRVQVVKSFQKTTFVRSKLTAEEEALAKDEEKKGRRPMRPLLPGERVITRHVLELTSALESALSSQKSQAE
jgi:multidrug efflux pump subunit AcrA (membrane-fusion protein)